MPTNTKKLIEVPMPGGVIVALTHEEFTRGLEARQVPATAAADERAGSVIGG